MTTLLIRVNQPSLYSDGVDTGMFAIADVVPYNRGETRAIGRGQRGLIVLVGDNAQATPVTIEPGTYLVRAKLPSGEVLTQMVETEAGKDPHPVLLQADPSPHEWLSVEKSQGMVPTANAVLERSRFQSEAQADLVAKTPDNGSSEPKPKVKRAVAPRTAKKKASRRPARKASMRRSRAAIETSAASREATMSFHGLEDLARVRLRLEGYDASLALAEFSYSPGRGRADVAMERVFGELVAGKGLASSEQTGLFSVAVIPPHVQLGKPPRTLVDAFPPWNAARPGPHYRRRFAFLAERGKLTRAGCVPNLWYKEGRELPMRVLVRFDEIEQGAQLSISITDPKIASVLGFLSRGDLSSASAVISDSYEMLLEKMSNPYAAAAGGYVLVFTGGGTLNPHWREWIGNLASRFPEIPDGAILKATLILQGQGALSPEGAADAKRLLLHAVEVGPPYFRFGVRALSENLEILASLFKSPADQESIKQALRHARWMARRVSMESALTVLDISS